jgi:hypothetical protein
VDPANIDGNISVEDILETFSEDDFEGMEDFLGTGEPSPAKLKGKMTYTYGYKGENKRSDVTADTTFDAILRGERTATTRYDVEEYYKEKGTLSEVQSDKIRQLEYWKSAKVGDIITWEAADGRTVDVVVTKALHPLKGSGKTAEEWSKLEGWSKEYFNSKVRPQIELAWQMEYKLLTPTQPSTKSAEVKIEATDKIIWGHPTIGKSYLKKQGENRFITLDDDYKNEVNAFVDANRGSETRQEYKGRKPKEYNKFMLDLYDRLKVQAAQEDKILFVSNTNILKERMSDFDKVINIPKEEFKRRFD